MKDKYLYVPTEYKPGDNREFHRIREWWNTFNATLSALIATSYSVYPEDEELNEMKRSARRVANNVHGSIRKRSTTSTTYGRLF